jgi:rod shape-determining protein MreC
MTRFLYKHRILITVIGILLISTFLPPVRNIVLSSTSPVVMPLRRAIESTARSWRTLVSIPIIAKENGRLSSRVHELESVVIKNAELQHENDILRKELNLSANPSTELIAAQVISRSVSVTQQRLLLNKGTNDGMAQGMGIIAQGFLVGYVDKAMANTAEVILVTSAEAHVPVVLQNSRSLGLMKGGAFGIVVEEIPRDVAITQGEAIVTTTTGDIIKGGIPIGTAGTVLSTQSDVFQSVRVASPIDFSRLEIVFGVK